MRNPNAPIRADELAKHRAISRTLVPPSIIARHCEKAEEKHDFMMAAVMAKAKSMAKAVEKNINDINTVSYTFRVILPAIDKVVIFEAFNTVIRLSIYRGDFSCEIFGLPYNWRVWLCRQGIAIGRIPKFMDPEKALRHSNRVKLLPWWEASSTTDPQTGEDIDLSPKYPFPLDYDASDLALRHWDRFVHGLDFFPWKDLTSAVEKPQGFQDVNDMIDYIKTKEREALAYRSGENGKQLLDDEEHSSEEDSEYEATITQARLRFHQEEVIFWGYSEGCNPDQLDPPPISQESIHYLPTQELAEEVQRCLKAAIKEVASDILCGMYLMNPEKGFQQVNSLPLSEVFKYMMVGLNNQSAETAVCSYFVGRPDIIPTVVLKVRNQFRAEAVKALSEVFTKKLLRSEKLKGQWIRFGGYLVLAVDGTDFNLLRNDGDAESSCAYSRKGARPYNQLHCTTIYDVFNGLNIAYRLTSKKKTNERGAMVEMLDDLEEMENVLLLADRGFESWEVLATLCHKKKKFIIRLKDSVSNGILKGFDLEGKGDEFQVFADVTLCRKKPRKKEPGSFYKEGNFSFLDGPDATRRIKLRFFQFRLPNGKLECLVTNVPTWELSTEDLKVLYDKRWGVEVSYRNLKYYTNTCFMHSKDSEYARQELHAKMTMFNYSSFLIKHIEVPGPRRKAERKYEYRIKLSRGTALSAQFLKGTIDAETLATSIVKCLQPVRPGRSFRRDVRPQSAKPPVYRGIGA